MNVSFLKKKIIKKFEVYSKKINKEREIIILYYINGKRKELVAVPFSV
jgi:hypothetical protein